MRRKEHGKPFPLHLSSALTRYHVRAGHSAPDFSSSSLNQSFPLSTLQMKWNNNLVKFSKIVKKKFRWQVAQGPLQHQGVSGFRTVGDTGPASLLLGAPLSSFACSAPSSSHRTCLQDATENDNSNLIMANSHLEFSESHDSKYLVLLFP